MVDVITITEIEAPLRKVCDYALDPINTPEWYENFESAARLTPVPLAIGSRIEFVKLSLWRKLRFVYEVTDLKDRKLVMRTLNGPFPMETTYLFEKITDKRTRMILRNRGEASGLSRIATPIISWFMRKANTNDLVRIKSILEER